MAVSDIMSDVVGALGNFSLSPRYRINLHFMRQLLEPNEDTSKTLNGKKIYFITHSLGGGICDSLMADNIGSFTFSINPAIDQVRAGFPNNNYRLYMH